MSSHNKFVTEDNANDGRGGRFFQLGNGSRIQGRLCNAGGGGGGPHSFVGSVVCPGNTNKTPLKTVIMIRQGKVHICSRFGITPLNWISAENGKENVRASLFVCLFKWPIYGGGSAPVVPEVGGIECLTDWAPGYIYK